MLQNHVGDREFPVRPRWRYVRTVRQLALQRNRNAASLATIARIGPALVVAFVLILSGRALIPVLPPPFHDDDGYVLLIALVLIVLVPVGLVGGGLIDRSLPLREQRRYRELTASADLTDRQQTLLALDVQSDFSIGGWNSSLEYAPSWRCLPRRIRDDWEHRRGRSLFTTLPLQPIPQLRVDLDERFGIASAQDVELFVADTLTGSGYGARFHEVLEGPDGERMLARLASLTGRDQWSLRELDQAPGDRPAELLRGGDAQRLITVVRLCYAADHVDADTAWRLIERAAESAFATYSGWDDYWRSVRTAIAFATDRLEQVQRFDESMAALRTSGWPATRIAFPTAAVAPRSGTARAPSDPEDAAR